MTNLPTIMTSRNKLTLGFTQLFNQEFLILSKQAVSTIIDLITIKYNSGSEVCEVEALKSSTI
jgi:hypothetical protein